MLNNESSIIHNQSILKKLEKKDNVGTFIVNGNVSQFRWQKLGYRPQARGTNKKRLTCSISGSAARGQNYGKSLTCSISGCAARQIRRGRSQVINPVFDFPSQVKSSKSPLLSSVGEERRVTECRIQTRGQRYEKKKTGVFDIRVCSTS